MPESQVFARMAAEIGFRPCPREHAPTVFNLKCSERGAAFASIHKSGPKTTEFGPYDFETKKNAAHKALHFSSLLRHLLSGYKNHAVVFGVDPPAAVHGCGRVSSTHCLLLE